MDWATNCYQVLYEKQCFNIRAYHVSSLNLNAFVFLTLTSIGDRETEYKRRVIGYSLKNLDN